MNNGIGREVYYWMFDSLDRPQDDTQNSKFRKCKRGMKSTLYVIRGTAPLLWTTRDRAYPVPGTYSTLLLGFASEFGQNLDDLIG